MSLTRILILVGAAFVLAAVNVGILGKEGIKRDGVVIYLDLQPVDPRSLVQGDYMTLRFRLAEDIRAHVKPLPAEGEMGRAEVNVGKDRVASLAKAGDTGNLRVRYRVRKGNVWLGTNAFFFEEGSEKRFAPARYGEFRVDAGSGEAVLVGLRDSALKPL